MIVVDSSAVIAILEREPEEQAFERAIADEDRCLISAVNAHEAAVVLRVRHGRAAVERVWHFLDRSEMEIVPFDESQMRAAVLAYDRYGKGIDRRARLNLCDCAAYALAVTMNAPLLFKGNDFSETDVQRRV